MSPSYWAIDTWLLVNVAESRLHVSDSIHTITGGWKFISSQQNLQVSFAGFKAIKYFEYVSLYGSQIFDLVILKCLET